MPPLPSLLEGDVRSCLAGMVSPPLLVLRRDVPGGTGGELAWMLANFSASKLSLPTWGACRRSMADSSTDTGMGPVFGDHCLGYGLLQWRVGKFTVQAGSCFRSYKAVALDESSSLGCSANAL